jgi:hypothetical protein
MIHQKKGKTNLKWLTRRISELAGPCGICGEKYNAGADSFPHYLISSDILQFSLVIILNISKHLNNSMRFENFITAKISIVVSGLERDVCGYERCGGTCCSHLQSYVCMYEGWATIRSLHRDHQWSYCASSLINPLLILHFSSELRTETIGSFETLEVYTVL